MYPRQGDSKYRPAQMTHLNDVISYLDDLLEAPDFPDYGPNGLQVPGPKEVTIVATGVSAHLDLVTQAAEAGAQLVIAHHGLFWDFHPRSLSPTMKERLRVLFDNDSASRLPRRSTHTPSGQQRAHLRGARPRAGEPFGQPHGRSVGYSGARPRGSVRRAQTPLRGGVRPGAVRSGTAATSSCAASGSCPARPHRASGEAIALGLDAFPHRRAARARDGGRSRERHALHRRRPLRIRDVRRSGSESSSRTGSNVEHHSSPRRTR